MKYIRCEDHDYSDFPNQSISECENRDYSDFSNHEHEAYLHKPEISAAKHTKEC